MRAMDIKDLLAAVYAGRPPKVPAKTARALSFAPPVAKAVPKLAFERLPPAHRALLVKSDGLELLSGSYRLFGWAHGRRLPQWNEDAAWKFAWGERAAPYFCFGESVLGNQFAYRQDELDGAGTPRVYELYAVTLEPLCNYPDFAGFLDGGFFNGVQDDPYHARIAQARAACGGFAPDQHMAYMPSPLLNGGQLGGLQLVPMEARAHMIINGDLWCQLAHRHTLAGLHGIDSYTDAAGRPRLRAVWGSPELH
jgi:hypothetical protein